LGVHNIIPSKQMFLDIDSAKVANMGIIPANMKGMIVPRMQWSMKSSILEKKDVMVLDLIATNNWERPIYFNNTSRMGVGLNLNRYLVQEGNAFRLLPVDNGVQDLDMVNSDLMFENMMTKFQFRELDNPAVYYNEDYRKFVLNHRASFNTLIATLINEGKEAKALEVLNKNLEAMPDVSVPYDYTTSTTIQYLFILGEIERAKTMAVELGNRADEKLTYYIENDNNIGFELQQNLVILRELSQTLNQYGETELAQQFGNALNEHYTALQVYGPAR
jgi:hypothetical protein